MTLFDPIIIYWPSWINERYRFEIQEDLNCRTHRACGKYKWGAAKRNVIIANTYAVDPQIGVTYDATCLKFWLLGKLLDKARKMLWDMGE